MFGPRGRGAVPSDAPSGGSQLQLPRVATAAATASPRATASPKTTRKKPNAATSEEDSSLLVKFEDLYSFNIECNIDDVNILNDVAERVRMQDKVWSELEESKGADWYLQPEFLFNSEGLSMAMLKPSVLSDIKALKKLIRKGVPPSFRPKVWLAISGAAKKRSAAPESYYHDLISATEGKITPATMQIDNDLPRTSPGHKWLDTAEGQASLRRVLVGYSFRDSEVGYCQGLNYVAALLLLVMETEEEAFWMLAVLLENVLVNDCYTKDLSGCHVEHRTFRQFLVKNCPRINAHFEDIEFDFSLVTTEWFLCLFSKSLPTETTLRVWDVLFSEGAKFLFTVALAIFKMNEEELLNTHNVGDMIKMLQRATIYLYNPDELLMVAFDKISPVKTILANPGENQQTLSLKSITREAGNSIIRRWIEK